MSKETDKTGRFYRTLQGAVAGRLVRERLTLAWPALPGMAVLGVGHAGPYLSAWTASAERCIALTPAQLEVTAWPDDAANLACCAEEDRLPFPDLCFDRILLVHGLEAADNAGRMLREVWRVLKDDGRLLVVAPNRVGLWAQVESTPFGHGHPYSHGQIGRLLATSLFRVESMDSALYMPPVRLRAVLRSAGLWEQAGRRVVPRLAGVTITEAVKDVYAGLTLRAVQQRKLVLGRA